jgi:NAD(P)-dependent dehydrogenase (short-subunit alcohol dehydrogenase family)
MLGLDMALDADLGIDSIKRVEILSALQERLPEAPAVKPEHLGTLHTLRAVADFLAGQAPAGEPPGEPALPGPGVERSVLRAVPLDAEDTRPFVRLAPGSEVWVTGAEPDLTEALARRLEALGLCPRIAPAAELARREPAAGLAGLVLLAPRAGVEDPFVADALRVLRHASPALRAAGRRGGAVLLTVSRLDGAFGLANLDPGREPVDGALAGLAKTAAAEWPEVCCKALDLAGDFAGPDEAVALVVEEMLRVGPAEVGLAAAGRCTLERVVQPLESGTVPVPLAPGEVVVLSGGARGVTAEAAVALARAFRPTLVLLGRSPEPGPEPDWLAPLSGEVEIKRALALRANGAGPRRVGEEYGRVAAGREVRRTLARIEAAGGRAVYRGVDVRDPAAVAGVLGAVRREFGPVRGLVHGAGVLADARIEDKTDEQFDRVWGTKVAGLRNLLAAVGPGDLRVLVLFSSSSGRFGRAGQVDYAAANEMLNKMARRLARLRPGCRVVSVNWGPWDGGMVNPALKKLFEAEGIGLIVPEAGADFLVRELRSPGPEVEVVVLAPAAPPSGPGPLSVAFERSVDLGQFPVLTDHVLDGRPVVPAVLLLEWLAHAALHHNPGLHFHGCDDFRILHGVILDEPAPPVVRVAAGKAALRGGLWVAPAEVRGRRGGREVVHARADVVLAAELPAAPPAAAVPALDAYGHGLGEIYERLLFHGPRLEGIEEIEGCGPAGIAGRVRAAPVPAEWVAAPLRRRWLSDPLVLDGSFQLMVLWTRRQRGTPCLPCRLGRYRQYERAFPSQGTRVVASVRRAGDLHALADVDFLAADGRLVARLEGYECVLDPGLERAFARRHAALA